MYTYQLRVKKIYFHDEDTDFYIFAGKDLNDDAAKDRKVKGNFFTPIKSGVELEVKGEWESSKYGPTLVCKKSKVMMASNEGVKKYLANNVKSIGKVTAGKIVNAWGNNTADVLDNEPERIEELDFLSAKQKKALLNEWSQARSYRRVATKLLGLGLPKYVIKKIFNKYGDETLEIVKQNPYALTEIRGVGFQTVDELALKAGLARDSEERIRGFVLETLSSVTYGQGHLYLTPKEIFKRLNKMPQRQNLALFGRRISSKEIDEQIELLDMAGAVVKERNEVYLKEFHQAEQRSAELLASFVGDQDLEVDTDAFIEEYESTYKITFSDEQAEAIHALNNEKILLLTGLPGTGKTTLTKALVRLFKRADKKFQLMSPTGIAAKKLSTVVGQDASTIHRLLGYQGSDTQWKYNENNKFAVDAVIVDEFSMVDQQLFVNLLSALEKDTTLVFVGDHAQLPSVGPGNVLHELINSGEIKQINLTKIFRQEQASDIVVNAHKINSGKEPDLGDPSDPQVDVKFISADTPSKILHGIREVVQRLWDKDNDRTFQVLSPTYKSPIGVDALNDEIKEMLNPLEGNKQEVYLGANSFREDDRIMVVENDYSIDTYNGEIGKVVRVNRANKELRVKIFDEPLDKMHDIPYDKAKTLLAPAYSITIHKCLHPDTLVETEDGLVRIEDISDTGVIATPSGPLDYKNKVHNTVNEALELSCDTGYGLTVTPDHGLDVWDGDSYIRKEAKDFAEGEFLRFKLGTTLDPNPPRLPEPTAGDVREAVYSVPEEMTEDLAELLGLLVADGCLYSRGFRLKKRHSDAVERFGELCKQIFGCDPKKSENYQDENATGSEVNSTFLTRWLASLGGLSYNAKAIPSVILRSPLSMQKSFLRGLFADGTVSWKNNRLDHIAFTQKGSEIARTVQIMLLRMGIISSRSNPPSKGDLETLALYGDHARLFRDEIGFVSEFKQSRLVQSSIGKSRHDVVPFSKGEIRSLWGNHRDVFPNVYAKQNALHRGYLSRSVVLEMRNKLADKGVILPWLNERLSWHHVRVSSIEKTFCESYCVEVPDGHQFLQNGCSGWNSQGQEWDYVLFPFHKRFSIQLQRNLLYTALTRARRKVFIFGQYSALMRAVRNNRVEQRNTKFAKRLQDLLS